MHLLKKTLIIAATCFATATSYGVVYEAKGLIVEGDFAAMDGSIIAGETEYVSVMEFDFDSFSLLDTTVTEIPGEWTNWSYHLSTSSSVHFQAGNYMAFDIIEAAWLTLFRQTGDPAGLYEWGLRFDGNYSSSGPSGSWPDFLQIPIVDPSGETTYLDLSSSFSWFGFTTGFFGDIEIDPASHSPDLASVLGQLGADGVETEGDYLASWFGIADSNGTRTGIFNGRDYAGAQPVPDASNSLLAGYGFLALLIAHRAFPKLPTGKEGEGIKPMLEG